MQLPVWFQAIKGASAIRSGVMNLPLILTLTVFTIVSGAGIEALGYYGPFLVFSSIFSAIGVGLLTTFSVTSSSAIWIGYQVIYGAGVGAGLQAGFTIVQAALPVQDIPIAIAMMTFAQTLGGALFISVAQNVFTNLLIQNLKTAAPEISASIVVSTGATALRKIVDKASLPGVLIAYNDALTRTYVVSVATAAASIVGVLMIDWRVSLKKDKSAETGTPEVVVVDGEGADASKV